MKVRGGTRHWPNGRGGRGHWREFRRRARRHVEAREVRVALHIYTA